MINRNMFTRESEFIKKYFRLGDVNPLDVIVKPTIDRQLYINRNSGKMYLATSLDPKGWVSLNNADTLISDDGTYDMHLDNDGNLISNANTFSLPYLFANGSLFKYYGDSFNLSLNNSGEFSTNLTKYIYENNVRTEYINGWVNTGYFARFGVNYHGIFYNDYPNDTDTVIWGLGFSDTNHTIDMWVDGFHIRRFNNTPYATFSAYGLRMWTLPVYGASYMQAGHYRAGYYGYGQEWEAKDYDGNITLLKIYQDNSIAELSSYTLKIGYNNSIVADRNIELYNDTNTLISSIKHSNGVLNINNDNGIEIKFNIGGVEKACLSNGSLCLSAADDDIEGGQIVLISAPNQNASIKLDNYGAISSFRIFGDYDGITKVLNIDLNGLPLTQTTIGDVFNNINPFVMAGKEYNSSSGSTKTTYLNAYTKISTDVLPSGFYDIDNTSGSDTSIDKAWYNILNIRHSNSTNQYGFQLLRKHFENQLLFREVDTGTYGNLQMIYTDKYMTDEFPKASVKLSADITYVVGTPNIIPFDTVEFITNASLSNGKITINQSGYYAFYGSVLFSPDTALSTSDRVYIEIYVNGVFTHGRFVYGNGSTNLETLEIYQMLYLNSGDNIALYVFSEVGGGNISYWQRCTRMQIIRIH